MSRECKDLAFFTDLEITVCVWECVVREGSLLTWCRNGLGTTGRPRDQLDLQGHPPVKTFPETAHFPSRAI